MLVEEIARGMTGRLQLVEAGREEAFLPSPAVQNHASILAALPGGTVACAWFGGSLEGKADICIRASLLLPGAPGWGPVATLSQDAAHSEQNPVLFPAPDGRLWLFHTVQASGNQDTCRVRMVELHREDGRLRAGEGRFLDLPRGSFVRAGVQVLGDGSWLLPLFLCVPREGRKWTGSHDEAAVAISRDGGQSWTLDVLPGSIGCVHTCPVPMGTGFAAFFRRRQSDQVHRATAGPEGTGWSVPEPVDVPNNNSSIAALRLGTGEIAMICNPVNAAMSASRRASLYDELGEEDDRPDADPEGGCVPIWGVERAPVALCLSRDDGRSFPLRFLVEDGPGTCLSNNSLDGRNRELSYPWLLETADGALHLSYSFHRRAIKHVRLAPGWRDRLPRLQAG
ncbi:exo-alpha-sialidase [Poseidonocella sp. HB161398]|uniref:sialidase family protein n=1 Tax=Poseidonocella sp. HB161398 TaxID=2320855 RepID=UPI0011090562|nr:exo-alpha-sialidase [Poseidonocella sp. HB161398]